MTCYACDSKATGHAMHNGKIKTACSRHAEAALSVCLCTGKVFSHQGVIVNFAPFDAVVRHAKCHKESLVY